MVEITLQPRVQKDKWSMYWKESMATKTDSLESTTILADINTTVAALQQVSKSSVEQFVSFIACQHILRVFEHVVKAQYHQHRSRVAADGRCVNAASVRAIWVEPCRHTGSIRGFQRALGVCSL